MRVTLLLLFAVAVSVCLAGPTKRPKTTTVESKSIQAITNAKEDKPVAQAGVETVTYQSIEAHKIQKGGSQQKSGGQKTAGGKKQQVKQQQAKPQPNKNNAGQKNKNPANNSPKAPAKATQNGKKKTGQKQAGQKQAGKGQKGRSGAKPKKQQWYGEDPSFTDPAYGSDSPYSPGLFDEALGSSKDGEDDFEYPDYNALSDPTFFYYMLEISYGKKRKEGKHRDSSEESYEDYDYDDHDRYRDRHHGSHEDDSHEDRDGKYGRHRGRGDRKSSHEEDDDEDYYYKKTIIKG